MAPAAAPTPAPISAPLPTSLPRPAAVAAPAPAPRAPPPRVPQPAASAAMNNRLTIEVVTRFIGPTPFELVCRVSSGPRVQSACPRGLPRAGDIVEDAGGRWIRQRRGKP